jgi:predicted nucleic acid-binding protein
MILVDSSVWIDYFNGVISPASDCLDYLMSREELAVGDLIALEVLQGFRNDRDFKQAKEILEDFTSVNLVNYELAVHAASNYRTLRGLGFTIRKTIDVVIATWCIQTGNALLHSDRDFLPFVENLGLKVVPLSAHNC